MKLNEKGITLIALIITIIVMLILVIVTVQFAVNGNLFNLAKSASKDTMLQAEREELIASIAGAYDAAEGTIDAEKFTNGLSKDWTVGASAPFICISPSGNQFVVAADGTISDLKTKDLKGSLVELYDNGDLKVGDYVLYNPNTQASSYTIAPEKSGLSNPQTVKKEGLTWRVMGKDSSGNLLLISSTPTNETINFYGHVGYNNYEEVLNNTCSNLYSNSSLGITARSINEDDIEMLIGSEVMEDGKANYCDDSYNTYGYIGFKKSFTNIYLPTNWSATNNVELEHDAYWIDISDYDPENFDENNLDLLMGPNYNYGYLIADKKLSLNSNEARWSIGVLSFEITFTEWSLCYSNGTEEFLIADINDANFDAARYSGGVSDELTGIFYRPIVVVPSSVKAEDVKVLDGEMLYSWNFINEGSGSGDEFSGSGSSYSSESSYSSDSSYSS